MADFLKNYRFIEEIDGELEELLDGFIMEVSDLIYVKLVEHYPGYKQSIRRRSELSEILFKGNLDLNEQYGNVSDEIEAPLMIADFLTGVRLGRKMT